MIPDQRPLWFVPAFHRVRPTCHGGDVPQTISGTTTRCFRGILGNDISKCRKVQYFMGEKQGKVPELHSHGSASFSVPDFPRPRLELPVRVPLRTGGRHEVPGEETEGELRRSGHLRSPAEITNTHTYTLPEPPEPNLDLLCGVDLREPARRAAERAQTHPLLLHQHLLLPDASPRPQSGHQPSL